MAANPLILDAQALKRLPVPNTAIAQMPSGPLPVPASVIAAPTPNVSLAPMAAPPPSIATPPMPSVIKAPDPAIQNTGARLLGDQTELKRIEDTGSGVSQIKNPFLRGLARVGDVAASVVAPGVAAAIPGTTNHHNFLINQEVGRVNNDLGNQQEQAQTTLLDAQPQLKQMAAENNMLKTAGYLQHVNDQGQHYDQQYVQNLRDHGYAPDESDPSGQKLRPLRYEEMSGTQQAVEDLKHAQAEEAEAAAAMKKAQNDPTSPAFLLAKQRADVAQQNAQIARGRLGLAGQRLELRRENQRANLYGTDMDGNPIPGAPQLEDDEGNLQTVGLRAGNLAVKQQGKVTSFNDLQGSTQHARKALEALHTSGADLSDPNIVMAMSDPSTIAGKVINGKFVKANLTPQQVQAIGAINQLREQIGIMRATTGGPAAEAQAQRMLSALPEAGDSRSTAINKMDELSGVIDRLRPGAVHVAGGLKVTGQGTGSQKFTVNGRTYNIPSDKVAEFKKDHPNAR